MENILNGSNDGNTENCSIEDDENFNNNTNDVVYPHQENEESFIAEGLAITPSSNNYISNNLIELELRHDYSNECSPNHSDESNVDETKKCDSQSESVTDFSYEKYDVLDSIDNEELDLETEEACRLEKSSFSSKSVEDLFIQMIVNDVLGVEDNSFCEEDVLSDSVNPTVEVEDQTNDVLHLGNEDINFNILFNDSLGQSNEEEFFKPTKTCGLHDVITEIVPPENNFIESKKDRTSSTSERLARQRSISIYDNPIFDSESIFDIGDSLITSDSNIVSCFQKIYEEYLKDENAKIQLDFCPMCQDYYDDHSFQIANDSWELNHNTSKYLESKSKFEDFVNISYDFNRLKEPFAFPLYCSLWQHLQDTTNNLNENAKASDFCKSKAKEDLALLLQIIQNVNDVIKEPDIDSCSIEGEDEKETTNIIDVKISDKYTCSICLDLLYQPYNTPCCHTFCAICLRQLNRLTNRKPRCPLCRHKILFVRPCKAFEEEIKTTYPSLYSKRAEADSIDETNSFPLPAPSNVQFNNEDSESANTRLIHWLNVSRTCLLLLIMVANYLSNIRTLEHSFSSRVLIRVFYATLFAIFTLTSGFLLYLFIFHIHMIIKTFALLLAIYAISRRLIVWYMAI